MTISENIPLAPYTTFKVGGSARYFSVVKSEADLGDALRFARERSLRVFVLGGGSNIVVSDDGFDGLVIKMEMKGIEFHPSADGSVVVAAAAGEWWDDLVRLTVENGLWGLENLSLIPGTVGAAPVQNIGAYGAEAKDTIESVCAVDRETGAARIFTNVDCRFGYRDSIFKTDEGKKWIIVSVSFRLSSVPRPNLSYKDLKEYFGDVSKNHQNFVAHDLQQKKVGNRALNERSQTDIRDAVIAIRTGKFPDLSVVGTAGSFWKNPIIPRSEYDRLAALYPGLPSFPAGTDAAGSDQSGNEQVKVPLAWILDKICGRKGYELDGVGLFSKQPLVLVAYKGATASRIRAFEAKIRAIVAQKTALNIEPEVGFLC